MKFRLPTGRWLRAFVALILIAAQPGCGAELPVDEATDERDDVPREQVTSEKSRITSLSASDVKLDELVRGNSAFAFDLYRRYCESRMETCSIRRTASRWHFP